MTTPVSKLQSISKRTKIPYKVLEEVYKRSLKSKTKRSPTSKAKRNVEFFIKEGCTFKLYPKIVNKAINQMSQTDAKAWCERQIKK